MNRRDPLPERAVIRQLARIDLHIRRRWWRNYVDNPTWSFSKSISAAEALADNQYIYIYIYIFIFKKLYVYIYKDIYGKQKPQIIYNHLYTKK